MPDSVMSACPPLLCRHAAWPTDRWVLQLVSHVVSTTYYFQYAFHKYSRQVSDTLHGACSYSTLRLLSLLSRLQLVSSESVHARCRLASAVMALAMACLPHASQRAKRHVQWWACQPWACHSVKSHSTSFKMPGDSMQT
jgi:hypothetical protein